MTSPIGQFVDSTSGRTSTSPFITIIMARAPTGNDGINNALQVGQRWVNTADDNEEWFLLGFTASGGYIQANWVLLTAGSTSTETLTGNSGIATAVGGNINVVGDGTTGGLFAGAGDTLTLTLNAIPNSALAHSSITLTQGTGISITGSPVSLGGAATIAAGSTVPTTFHTDSGDAIPSANQVTFHGTGGITTSGSGSTVTINGSGGTPGELVADIQIFTTSGTYFPSAGMQYAQIEIVGGGGGGAGVAGGTNGTGGGGGAGGYSLGIYSAATIGASQVVTIGALGGGGAAGDNDGLSGGTTTVGALIAATGGSGGNKRAVTFTGMGGAGGVGSLGSVNITGNAGSAGFIASGFIASGQGAGSFYGGSAAQVFVSTGSSVAGNAATSYGAGGGGALILGAGGPAAGGNGAAGVVVITEFGGEISPADFNWVDVVANTQAMAVNTGYVINNGGALVTLTLPALAAIGDTFIIQGQSAGGWKVNVGTGQIINLGNRPTTITTGSVASTNQWDEITIRCTTANTTFSVAGPVGNFTIN